MDEKSRAERIYQFWQTHLLKNGQHRSYASVAKQFQCSREWVRVVINRAIQAKAQQQAKENEYTPDSLNGE